ncbi:MAG: transcription repressor NadR [Clostridiales bacterium]|jgi:transcriptional regulator of NAD metabolism|nr:transcription repressor NadR [Clostridiales bacterium]
MTGNERREKLIQIIRDRTKPISGGELAKMLGVSRQVIVQDIALLRASDFDIISTTKGYMLYQTEDKKIKRVFMVKHSTKDIEDELCTIVDNGGKILDVHVVHEIYGQIVTELIIRNRSDVYDFVEKVRTKKIVPLKELTAGTHHHTIEADSEETLNRIEEALRRKNYLI